MEVFDKDIVIKETVPFLSTNDRSFSLLVPVMQIVQAIVYKLKTACKWAYVPVKEFVTERDYSWQLIYDHYSKWSKDKSWHKAWTGVFEKPKDIPGLSSVQLDGSHTPAEKAEKLSALKDGKMKKTNIFFPVGQFRQYAGI